jgi:hypothetical protein
MGDCTSRRSSIDHSGPSWIPRFKKTVARDELEDLYPYYASLARANWLIARVQGFRFRADILREIQLTLAEIGRP